MRHKLNELIKRRDITSSELIDLLASHDTLVKKVTCDYLADKSSISSDLSLLTANILLRDCSDPNPSIRGCSLLALSSLTGMSDASIPLVVKGLRDPSHQVRRFASHGCLRVYKHSPEELLASGIVDALYEGIRDPDPIYVTNCLVNLESILSEEGGIVINRNLAQYLAGRLSQFLDCNVVYVLNILKKFVPTKSEDVFGILNELDPFLTSTKPSVLIASVQLFLYMTSDYPHLTNDLLNIVSESLRKIMNPDTPELCYFILDYLQSSSLDIRNSFCGHFKYFLLRTKDPVYLRLKKLDFLPLIANEDNVVEIISELKHLASDLQIHKSVINCFAQLSTYSNDAERDVLTILTNDIKNSKETSLGAALDCLLSILMKKSELNTELHALPSITLTHTLCNSVGTAITQSSLIENNPILIFRLLQFISPYMINIQELIDELLKHEHDWDTQTKCRFITSVCVSFLHHPSVLQHTLSSVLSKALHSSIEEIRDHAAFVYASLEEGPLQAFKLLSLSNYYPFLDTVCKLNYTLDN